MSPKALAYHWILLQLLGCHKLVVEGCCKFQSLCGNTKLLLVKFVNLSSHHSKNHSTHFFFCSLRCLESEYPDSLLILCSSRLFFSCLRIAFSKSSLFLVSLEVAISWLHLSKRVNPSIDHPCNFWEAWSALLSVYLLFYDIWGTWDTLMIPIQDIWLLL